MNLGYLLRVLGMLVVSSVYGFFLKKGKVLVLLFLFLRNEMIFKL